MVEGREKKEAVAEDILGGPYRHLQKPQEWKQQHKQGRRGDDM